MDRTYIPEGEQIRLCRRAGRQEVSFTILGVVGEGSSSICYDAQAMGQRGKLKEFYPLLPDEILSLRRTEGYQLLPEDPASVALFTELCTELTQTYDTLDRVRSRGERGAILNNYIPSYQLYFGRSVDGQPGSVYVWTAGDMVGQDFDDYLRQVRNAPEELPEHKLYNILNTLITLSDCVRVFHELEMLHLDIKPSNFLVAYDSEMNINTGNISLYDLNSVRPVRGNVMRTAGTRGFRAPEVARGDAGNRSDIYSIGAMLFYAVVVHEQVPEGLYEDRYFDRLEELLEGSRLIRTSRTNSSANVRYILTGILRRTLAPGVRNRYICCEELIRDLKTAQAYLLPDIFREALPLERRLQILDRDTEGRPDPTAVLQDLLYRVPLYSVPMESGEDLRVLTVGAGTYGQKFMDLCLQTGQLLDHTLHITAVSRDMALDKEVYLHYRPALKQFVEVDGEREGACFARLDTRTPEKSFRVGDLRRQHSVARRLLDQVRPHYIFIALGDDRLDREAATAFLELGAGCPVAYVVQSGDQETCEGGIPVYVDRELGAEGISPELERMAFNTHLIWCDDDADITAERKRFAKPYYHDSSVSYVLSIPYKLYGLGLRLVDLREQAALVEWKLRDEQTLRRLVMLEHRRWVLEKVTDGWQLPTDESGATDHQGCVVRGRVKDEERKTHPCLLPSTEQMPLKGVPLASVEDLSGLDPLDRMSVELYRTFRTAAEEVRHSQPLRSADLQALRRIAEGKSEAVRLAYARYHQCLKRILEGNVDRCRTYGRYARDLEQSIEAEGSPELAEVRQRLEWLRVRFFPLIESTLERDYKSYDLTLVEKIPFILTNEPQPALAMALEEGDGIAMLSNVVSATVLRPRKISYLYLWGPDSDGQALKVKLRIIADYLERSHIRSETELLVGATADRISQARQALLDCPVKTRYLRCDGDGEALLEALDPGTLFDGDTALFRAPDKQPRFLELVRQKLGLFRFDRTEHRFTEHHGCDRLRYLRTRARLRVEELEALCGIHWGAGELPEYEEELEALWQIGTRAGGDCWSRLCRRLGEDAHREGLMGSARRGEEERTIRFYFPGNGSPGAERLLRRLAELGVTGEGSGLHGCASDTCQIEIFTRWELEPVLEKLFSRWYLLADPDRLEVSMDPEGLLWVRCDGLTVERLTGVDEAMWTVLEALYQAKLITMLRRDGEKVSFTYTSHRIRKLLTDPDRLLTVRCWYGAQDRGEFSDISCHRGALMLTDGFRPLPVCCVGGTPDRARYRRFAEETAALGDVCRTLVCQTLPDGSVLREAEELGIVTVRAT